MDKQDWKDKGMWLLRRPDALVALLALLTIFLLATAPDWGHKNDQAAEAKGGKGEMHADAKGKAGHETKGGEAKAHGADKAQAAATQEMAATSAAVSGEVTATAGAVAAGGGAVAQGALDKVQGAVNQAVDAGATAGQTIVTYTTNDPAGITNATATADGASVSYTAQAGAPAAQTGMAGMSGMSGMQGMSGGMAGMSGMSGMQGMSGGMAGMSGMSGMQGMAGAEQLAQSGMSGMGGMAGMSGMSGMAGMAGVQTAVQSSPEDLLRAAREAYWSQEFDRSIEFYQALLKQDDQAAYQGELANVFWKQGNGMAAVDIYVKIAPWLAEKHPESLRGIQNFAATIDANKAAEIGKYLK